MLKPPHLRATLALLTVAVLVPLSGCALVEGPTPETPPRASATAPTTPPEFFPEGSAEDNLPFFTEVLRKYSEGDGAIQGEPIVNAVTDSGFDKAAMQVSFDTSKTNLPADNIFVSVRVGSDCLIGQMVAEDRSFVAEVLPAVGPEGDICIIGETRQIDW